ncbi:MAG: serine hydrolase [Bryobacteraceae bacterium]|jgi:CubicO group peptidase (beta-lactamase class C family)
MRFLLAVAAASLVFGQPSPIQERIRAVESGLTPGVVLKGRPIPRSTIEERMKALHVRGVSVAIIQNYDVEWAKGYGFADLEAKRPVTTETLFQAGSISKPVAAVAAMKLVEQGKLRLDEEVNTFLKTWKLPDNEFTKEQKVTLRRIMSHSAGLTVHGFPGYAAGEPVPSLVEVLDGKKPANTAAIRVDILPGTQFRYSGGGYTIMQLAMIDVTGETFPALMQELVLSKAGMSHSTYEQPLPSALASVAASGYRSNGDAVAGRYHTYPEMAAAGLWTTATDLARFAIEIQKSREGQSNKILTKATVEEMLREQKKPYGLGFSLEDVGGSSRFGHGGADEGFQALLSGTFDGQGFAIMANSDNGIKLANEIALAISAAYHWPDKPREREAVQLGAPALAKFAGEYEAPQIGKVQVRVSGEHLVITVEGEDIDWFLESSTRAFALSGGLPDIEFKTDDKGAVTGFDVAGLHAKRLTQ